MKAKMSLHSQLDLISDHSKEKLIEVPKDVLEMRNLKMLFLEGNFIYRLPEGFFWKLPKLMWLDMRNNQLEGIPRSVAYHQCLENLLLTNNNISKLPNELGLVPNLKALQVSENPLVYPPRKIVAEGTKAIRKFLKDQYEMNEMSNEVSIDTDENIKLQDEDKEEVQQVISVEDSSCSEEKIEYIKSEDKRKIYNKLISDLKEKVADPYNLQPTLHVNKLRNDRKRQQDPVKIVHKIAREGPKIIMKSCLNKIGVRGNVIGKPTDETLREGWLNQLRILLTDQERIIQQERNLKTLSAWRTKARHEQEQTPKIFHDNDSIKPAPPYATDSEFSKMASRADLAKQLNVFFKNREMSKKGIEKKLDIEKLIIDLMEQLKEMEHTYTGPRSAKTEIEQAGKQMKTIMEIHKKLLRLKSSNDSTLS